MFKYSRVLFIIGVQMNELKDIINEISEDPIVIKWLNGKSKSSKRDYLYALADFCRANDIRPATLIETLQNEKNMSIEDHRKSVASWFNKYGDFCEKNGRTEKTWTTRMGIVNGFIRSNSLHGYSFNFDKISKRQLKKTHERQPLKIEDLKMALDGCKTWKMRSLILIQASSGISINHLINLKFKDFINGLITFRDMNNFKREICLFKLTREDGQPFITFISEEAVFAIKKYITLERPNLQIEGSLFTKQKQNNSPIHPAALRKAYRDLNSRIGWETEEKGSFRKATSSMIVNFFKSQMIDAGMPEETRKYLMGLKTSYQPSDIKKLQNTYFAYMEYLTIEPYRMDEYDALKEENEKLSFEMGEIIGQIDEAREKGIDIELFEDYKKLSEAFSGIQALNYSYEKRIESLESQLDELKRELADIKSRI